MADLIDRDAVLEILRKGKRKHRKAFKNARKQVEALVPQPWWRLVSDDENGIQQWIGSSDEC